MSSPNVRPFAAVAFSATIGFLVSPVAGDCVLPAHRFQSQRLIGYADQTGHRVITDRQWVGSAPTPEPMR